MISASEVRPALGLPFPERGDAEQALAAIATSAQAGHVSLHRCFTNGHKTMQLSTQPGLAARESLVPDMAQVNPPAFLHDQAFLYDSPTRASARWIENSSAVTPYAPLRAPESSRSVMSGSA